MVHVANEKKWIFGDLEPGGYDVIVADPPWRFRSWASSANVPNTRTPEKHYPVMGLNEIAALPVSKLAGRNCHLFLWATGPCLPQAFLVMKEWGFSYSSLAFTWVKLKRGFDATQLRLVATSEADLHTGLGLTTRKNAEFVLLGRRGSPRRHAKNVREVILAPVREHSRKPEEFRERVERYVGPEARIVELFARSPREGWAVWGNETDKFERAA